MSKRTQMVIRDVNGKTHKSVSVVVDDEKFNMMVEEAKLFAEEREVLWFINKSGDVESFNVSHVVSVTVKQVKRFWLF